MWPLYRMPLGSSQGRADLPAAPHLTDPADFLEVGSSVGRSTSRAVAAGDVGRGRHDLCRFPLLEAAQKLNPHSNPATRDVFAYTPKTYVA
jgi:hypothetical protein